MGVDILFLVENSHWVWLTLGGLLLAAEMLGGSGYLLWSGISAVIVGLLNWAFPLSWPWQGMLFATLTIITAILWWYWLRQRTRKSGGHSTLNQRSLQLIGVHATISEATQDGIGRAKIGDSTWRVKADLPLPVGTAVEVIAVEGITLYVRALRE